MSKEIWKIWVSALWTPWIWNVNAELPLKPKTLRWFFNDVKINIVDTPGHADFGGEVERTLRMVDGVLLLVDAKEGPMPQTKFVLKKALELGHKAIVVINKIDAPNARIDEVVNKTFDLFVNLHASDEQLDFPIIYASAISGTATLDYHKPGTDLTPLFETIVSQIPGPTILENEPLQILVLALAYDSYKGKLGIGKIYSGAIKKNMSIMQIAPDTTKFTEACSRHYGFPGSGKNVGSMKPRLAK
jgi:GTP-binding protein